MAIRQGNCRRRAVTGVDTGREADTQGSHPRHSTISIHFSLMNTTIKNSVFESFPILKTDRLVLREFSDSDTTDLFQIRSNPRIMEFMDSPTHQSLF